MDIFAKNFLRAMYLEHWLRFYFLKDAEGENCDPMQASAAQETSELDAVVDLPDEFAQKLAASDPDLVPMLDALQGKIVSMEYSRDVMFSWLKKTLSLDDGQFAKSIDDLRQDGTFKKNLDFFHSWVQELANAEIDLKGNALPPNSQADETVPSYAEWEQAFSFWFSLQKTLDLNSFPMA